MTNEQKPRLYSIGEAVADLQRTYPDVTHSSLRFLQRRGLVTTTRTAGGHRKYQQRDLDRIRTIKAWQAERLSLDDIGVRLARLEAMPSSEERWPLFLEHALSGRIAEAGALVLGADDVGVPLVDTFERMLMPALAEVGRRWESGELRVDQEHEVSELCRDLISELALRHITHPVDGRAVLAATVENELHDIGLRMVCGLLRQRGIAVHFLGAGLPTDLLLESVMFRRPDIVLLSVTIDVHIASLRDTLSRLPAPGTDAGNPLVVVGGQGAIAVSGIDTAAGRVIPPSMPLATIVEELAGLQAPE